MNSKVKQKNEAKVTALPVPPHLLARIPMIADAIIAGDLQLWAQPQPFFCTFIDYISLSIPESVNVSVIDNVTGEAASTNPGHLTLPVACTPIIHRGAPSSEEVSLAFHGGDPVTAAAFFQELWKATVTMAASLSETSYEKESRRISSRLADGLKGVLQNKKDLKGLQFTSDPPPSGNEFGLDLAKETLSKFAGYLDSFKSHFTVVLPFASANLWHFVPFAADVTNLRAWLPGLRNSFVSGFSTNTTLDKSKSLLCIPCHFLGVPWLLLCKELAGSESARWWQAYVSYRDIASRFTQCIRISAPRQFAGEMLRYFKEIMAGRYFVDPAKARLQLQRAWENLCRIYPVPTPQLELAAESKKAARRALKFIDGTYQVVFARDNTNPFLNSLPALESLGQGWSVTDEKNLVEPFIEPALAELDKESAQHDRNVALAAYSVAHPFGKCFQIALASVRKLREELGGGLLEREWLKQRITEVFEHVQRCKRCSDLMDFVGARLQARSLDELAREKEAFFHDEEYAVFPKLVALEDLLPITTEGHKIRFSGAEPLRNLALKPFIPHKNTQVRPFDAVYDELFFEIALNASRHGAPVDGYVKLEVTFSDGTDELPLPGLIVSSAVKHPAKVRRLKLTSGIWNVFQGMGGLGFVEKCVATTGIGAIHLRALEKPAGIMFELRLGLHGLKYKQPVNVV
jgi:hypothetical protein